MNPKYQKVCAEIAKTEKKIEDLQAQLKELYDRKTEMENLEIINTVRAMVMDKNQIMSFLSAMKTGSGPSLKSLRRRYLRMSKRKGIRVLSMLALCAVLVCSFSLTAFAYADDTEQNLPVTEATQPEEMPETETTAETLPAGEPIDDEGNASTRDLLYDKATNKQFITIQTKNGNTFYIVIDYDAPINEEEEQYQTYFLNMVDESDLLALMDEDSVAALTTCTCTEKCEAGHVNTSCPVCKTNMSECTGATPEPEAPAEEPEPVADEKPQKNSNMGMIIVIIAVAGIGGAGYYYIKFVRGKKQKDEDMDFFDDEGYEEEPYINEDEEPQIAADDEPEDDAE